MFFLRKKPSIPSHDPSLLLQQEIERIQVENATLRQDLALQTEQSQRIQEQLNLNTNILSGFGQFGQSLTELKDSFHELSVKLNHGREDALTTMDISHQSSQQMGNLVSQLTQTLESTNSSTEQMNELEQETKGITNLVNIIHGVSEQTSLLALNASIEAARAGEHGRGFSVVATEVRSLASRASDATNEIDTVISRIRAQTVQVAGISRHNSEDMESLAQDAELARQRLAHLIDIANISSSTLGDSAVLAEVELANLEELEIKLSVYQVLAGLIEVSPDEIPDETQCRLGAWYYRGGGNEQFQGKPEYAAIEEPHRRVHLYAKEAVIAYQENDVERAAKALQLMESNNLDVMTRIRRLIQSTQK